MKLITRNEALGLRSPKGGWKRRTLEILKVPWPPKDGWIRNIHVQVTDEEYRELQRIAKGQRMAGDLFE